MISSKQYNFDFSDKIHYMRYFLIHNSNNSILLLLCVMGRNMVIDFVVALCIVAYSVAFTECITIYFLFDCIIFSKHTVYDFSFGNTKNCCEQHLRDFILCLLVDFGYISCAIDSWKLKYTDCVTLGQFVTGSEFDGGCPDGYQLVACNAYAPDAAVDSWYAASNGTTSTCYVQSDNGENQYATSICCQFREINYPTPQPTS